VCAEAGSSAAGKEKREDILMVESKRLKNSALMGFVAWPHPKNRWGIWFNKDVDRKTRASIFICAHFSDWICHGMRLLMTRISCQMPLV
jgi:hypothetical protein